MATQPLPPPSRSPLEQERQAFAPPLCVQLQEQPFAAWTMVPSRLALEPPVGELFPHLSQGEVVGLEQSAPLPHRPMRVGCLFSGGQAPGGHNVLWGLWEALQRLHPTSQLVGFRNGPGGLLQGKSLALTAEHLANHRNMGGFDLLGSDRTKIERPEDLAQALRVCTELGLEALIIIGGDDSNTNAAVLAEYALAQQSDLCVIGIPKTIDGDLQNPHQPISFGFDTATKLYSELIGNIARDAASARKYTHFIRLMGRSASHVTLECALQTHPNITLIGEEIAAEDRSLQEIVQGLADWYEERAAEGTPFGVVLLPEGLLEFIPECRALIQGLNCALGAEEQGSSDAALSTLDPALRAVWNSLPASIQQILLQERDPHGNVALNAIETERMLADMVAEELRARQVTSFHPITHYLGYEGRCALPTNFDATYCYQLGYVAASLALAKKSGYMACLEHLDQPPDAWLPRGVPLVRLMQMELRKGLPKPVISKVLVDLEGAGMAALRHHRGAWSRTEDYRQPGPIQFFGPATASWQPPLTLPPPEAF